MEKKNLWEKIKQAIADNANEIGTAVTAVAISVIGMEIRMKHKLKEAKNVRDFAVDLAYGDGFKDGEIKAYKNLLTDPQTVVDRGLNMMAKDPKYKVQKF